MRRLAHLFTSLAVAGVLTGAIIAACGRPGAPGEIPRLAPQPDGIGPSARPQPGPSSRLFSHDAGTRLSPGPVTAALVIPPTTFQAAAEAADADPPGDAGTTATAPDAPAADAPAPDAPRPPPPPPPDAATDGPAALPPVPDAGIPADSRMEPALGPLAR